jgi:predicted nuclease of predicted toxin-antitoxin system
MGAGFQIPFLVDEHLPIRLLLPILAGRGHVVTPVRLTSEDPEILARTEETASVIVSADR